jgi:acylphosphatase
MLGGSAMAKLVYYSGRVQGVGFRATAATIARRYPVRGWVRNLSDGRVELLAEGDAESVELLLADIRERMADCISNEEIHEREPDGSLVGFRIRP